MVPNAPLPNGRGSDRSNLINITLSYFLYNLYKLLGIKKMPRVLSVDEAFLFATAACEYSRAYIEAGDTTLEINNYDVLRQQFVIDKMRRSRTEYIKPIEYSVETDDAIAIFYHYSETCKKINYGNCGEQALMALDFFMQYAPDINAELYRIKNGDHNFLVVGRREGSDPENPETWGEEAHICDPWANAVYPAFLYLTKLKAYECVETKDYKIISKTIDYNPLIHALKANKTNNTNYLRKALSAEHLSQIKSLFDDKIQTILLASTELIANLNAIKENISLKDGEQNHDLVLIDKLILNLRRAILEIDRLNIALVPEKSYLPYRKKLEETLKKCADIYNYAITINSEELSVILLNDELYDAVSDACKKVDSIRYNKTRLTSKDIPQSKIHLFTINNQIKIVKHLLENRKLIESQNDEGQTPLSLAATSGHIEMVKMFLKLGAKVDTRDYNGWSPLHFAAYNGHLNIIQLLVTAQPDLINSMSKRHESPIYFACQNGHTDVVKFLHAKGASFNQVGTHKYNAFQVACLSNHPKAHYELILSLDENLFNCRKLKFSTIDLALKLHNINAIAAILDYIEMQESFCSDTNSKIWDKINLYINCNYEKIMCKQENSWLIEWRYLHADLDSMTISFRM